MPPALTAQPSRDVVIASATVVDANPAASEIVLAPVRKAVHVRELHEGIFPRAASIVAGVIGRVRTRAPVAL